MVSVIFSIGYVALDLLINVECHTIDSFQGKEAHVVIVCTCAYEKKVRNFMCSRRRVSVALSRAKERVVVLGSLCTMESSDLWLEILKSFEKVSSESKTKVL